MNNAIDFLISSIEYKKSCIVWRHKYIYEDLETGKCYSELTHINELTYASELPRSHASAHASSHELSHASELLVHKVATLVKTPRFREFLRQPFYGMELATHGHIIYIKPVFLQNDPEEVQINKIAKCLRVYHNNAAKASLIVHGALFNRHDRQYRINITSPDEYVIAVFELNKDNTCDKMLFYNIYDN